MSTKPKLLASLAVVRVVPPLPSGVPDRRNETYQSPYGARSSADWRKVELAMYCRPSTVSNHIFISWGVWLLAREDSASALIIALPVASGSSSSNPQATGSINTRHSPLTFTSGLEFEIMQANEFGSATKSFDRSSVHFS